MLNTSLKLLKLIAMVGALAAATWMGTAFAQTTPPPSTTAPPTTAETDTMEHYLTNHPKAADELHGNPALINNPQWLAQHPEVQNWMNRHPNAKADAAENPTSFVNHTERETLNKDRKAVTGTDEFLSKHPDMAKELNENPKLIDDPKFLATHPALDNYLKKNPGVRNEWMNHPEAFAKAARADERYNKTGKVPPIGHQEKPEAKK